MLQTLAVTFPFFALVALGYVAVRRRVLPLGAIAGLNVFVLYFALPCMLFGFGARTPIARLLDGPLALVWGAGALLMVAGLVALARRGGIGWNDASFGALVATFPNTGFMGVPLLAALLGAGAAGPAILTIGIDMVVTSSLCIALSRLGGDAGRESESGGDAVRALRQALRGMATNPMPWSILLGALASATGTALPGPLERTVAMLADAASPAALFLIGAVLARSATAPRPAAPYAVQRAAHAGDVPRLVIAKLVVHPLLILALARLAAASGLAVTPSAVTTLVLIAALPSASNVAMLAERLGADNDRITRVILWTTLGAVVTFPLATLWMS